MSEAVQIAVIVSIGPTLVGLFGVWASLKNGRSIKEVHTMVNSGATEQLRIGMISAKALAASTGNLEHLELAKVAEEKYTHSLRPAD